MRQMGGHWQPEFLGPLGCGIILPEEGCWLTLDLQGLIITLPIILLSLTVHEYAHAYTALLLGDRTAKWSGRLTLNPLAHLDPIGTLALILTRRFGWAKPVPVNPGYFKDRHKGMIMVSIAGPGSNLVLAIALAALFKALLVVLPPQAALTPWRDVLIGINQGVWINLGLFTFNLIPLPPLDGSKILGALLRGRMAYSYYRLEEYSPFIFLFIVLTPVARWILVPIIVTLYGLIM